MTEADVRAAQDAAVQRLEREADAEAKKTQSDTISRIKRAMAHEVVKQLTAFVLQDDTGELARAINKDGKCLANCLSECVKGLSMSSPAMSDIDVYTRALQYYLPEGKVRCSFRVVIPQEVDDDLAFLDVMDEPETGGAAQILDFFVGGDDE